MGLFNVIGSLQNIESAEAAGDRFPTAPVAGGERPRHARRGALRLVLPDHDLHRPSGLEGDGRARRLLGAERRVLHASSASPARSRYIAWAVPIDAGMAIVLWIGIVITAQAFQATPREHAPAVVIGLLPGVAAWGALLAKNGLRAAGMGVPADRRSVPQLIAAFRASDTWIDGAFALEQGFIFTSMILAATTVDGDRAALPRAARLWCLLGALPLGRGLIHSYRWTPGDTAIALTPAWQWAAGYMLMAAWLLAARRLTEDNDVGH